MHTKSISKINRIGKIGHISVAVILALAIIYTALLASAAIIVSADDSCALSAGTIGNKAFVSYRGGILEKAVTYFINDAADNNIVLFANPDKQVKVSVKHPGAGKSLTGENAVIAVSGEASADDSSAKNDILLVLSAAIVTSITVIFALLAIKNLLKYISSCSTPFDNNVVKKMRLFGFALIPVAVFSSVTGIITSILLNPSNQFNLYINKALLAAIIMVFVVAYILKYGILLQKESDETL